MGQGRAKFMFSETFFGDPRKPELHAKVICFYFSFVHGPCSEEDRVIETFFGDPRIANEPRHTVAVVLTIIKLSSKAFKPVQKR